jgi:hypothetical protein
MELIHPARARSLGRPLCCRSLPSSRSSRTFTTANLHIVDALSSTNSAASHPALSLSVNAPSAHSSDTGAPFTGSRGISARARVPVMPGHHCVNCRIVSRKSSLRCDPPSVGRGCRLEARGATPRNRASRSLHRARTTHCGSADAPCASRRPRQVMWRGLLSSPGVALACEAGATARHHFIQADATRKQCPLLHQRRQRRGQRRVAPWGLRVFAMGMATSSRAHPPARCTAREHSRARRAASARRCSGCRCSSDPEYPRASLRTATAWITAHSELRQRLRS